LATGDELPVHYTHGKERTLPVVLSFPPDWTFYFQIVLFLALWAFLRRFFFAPTFAVLQEREERSAGALQEASRVKAEAEAIEGQYKTRLAETRAGALQQVDAVYREAEEQARTLLDAARTEAGSILADLRATLSKEIAEARQSLDGRIPDFSREIAQKLLGRSLT
jgi:F-type H+-transporting ATPase subunit b